MKIRRAKVRDDEDIFVFHAYPDDRDMYRVERSDTTLVYDAVMWTNVAGLHVCTDPNREIYTVYPYHTIQWMEEVRP